MGHFKACLGDYIAMTRSHWVPLVFSGVAGVLWLAGEFWGYRVPNRTLLAIFVACLFIAQFQAFQDVWRESKRLAGDSQSGPHLRFARAVVDTLPKVDRFPEGDMECVYLEFENAPRSPGASTSAHDVIANVEWVQNDNHFEVLGWWLRSDPPKLEKPQGPLTFDLDATDFGTGAKGKLVIAVRELPNGLYSAFDKESFSYSGWQRGDQMLQSGQHYNVSVRLRAEGVDSTFNFLVL